MLRLAHPENAWKDVPHKPTYDHIVEADIRGDLNGNQAVAMANALDGIPRLAPTGPDWEDNKRRLAAGEKVKGI